MSYLKNAGVRLLWAIGSVIMFVFGVGIFFAVLPTTIHDHHSYAKTAREALSRPEPRLDSITAQLSEDTSIFHEINALVIMSSAAYRVEERSSRVTRKRIITPVFGTIVNAADRQVAAIIVFKNERELERWNSLPHPQQMTTLRAYWSVTVQGVLSQRPVVPNAARRMLLQQGYKVEGTIPEIHPFLNTREIALKRYTRPRYEADAFMALFGITALFASWCMIRQTFEKIPPSPAPEPRQKQHKHRK
ncbi:hypothetical protein [Thioclava sp. GXIMD4216]|uniref:hypothetical protein n=1 Tax=unclassified Thioclava TaxID=2621713 RepID=UPI0030D090CA